MKIVAVEKVDARIVEWLRAEGNDVRWILDQAPGISDPLVLDDAASDESILIKNDLDFGKLVVEERGPTRGVILLRVAAMPRSAAIERFKSVWPAISREVAYHLIVVSEKKVRIRKL